MRNTQIILSLILCLLLPACSDNQKTKEQADIDKLMAQHCEKISKLSEEEYIKVYMMHNSNTAKDRKEAIADYRSCVAKQQTNLD